MGRLSDKVAVITGAARYLSIFVELSCISGIGYESTLVFAKEGAKVVMADINQSAGEAALGRIKALLPSADILFQVCDVSSAPSVAALISAAESHFGRINVLFNNAGIMHAEDCDVTNTNDNIWDLTMDINAKGVFYCCRYGIPALQRAGGGSIINTASFVARLGAATPQIACRHTISSKDYRYCFERCRIGNDQGTCRHLCS
jgi:NAD(P)-dependent dehydrogenase (short-subunit alcohol dehydrogenase family)